VDAYLNGLESSAGSMNGIGLECSLGALYRTATYTRFPAEQLAIGDLA
jgi:hypothetical protein